MALSAGAAREWAGIHEFPEKTKEALFKLLERLREKGRDSLTILLLGKGGSGKSSTVNSLLGERVCSVSAFQPDVSRPVQVSRTFSGFTLTFVDSPGLVEGGGVSEGALHDTMGFLLGRTVDAVLFVDRMDCYRVDTLDRQIIEAITRAFGKKIWSSSALLLTHAQFPPPEGQTFAEYGRRRGEGLLEVIHRSAGIRPAKKGGKEEEQVPLVFAENSGRCATNEAGEKVLPDGSPWLLSVLSAIVERVEHADEGAKGGRGGVTVDEKMLEGPNPDAKGKWLIPVLIAAQVLLVFLPMRRAIDRDANEERGRRPVWEIKAEEYRRSGGAAQARQRAAQLRSQKERAAASSRGKGSSSSGAEVVYEEED